MALQDIINAIIQQADRDIATLRQEHDRRITTLRREHEAAVAQGKEQMLKQIAARKALLTQKTVTHVAVDRRNRVAEAKQSVLDAVFAEVVGKLAALPEAKTEAFLRACLKHIREKGLIRASKRHEAMLKKLAPSEQFHMGESIDAVGGFRFIGASTDADYTFEHIVHGILRPAQELKVAASLFGA